MALAFSPASQDRIKTILGRYPNTMAACLPLLYLAQEEFGYLSPEAMELVAEALDLAPSHVYGVATFYTMFNLEPVGENHVQLCGTTPCWLRGADDLKAVCEKMSGPKGSVSEDGKLSWVEVECLGACANAPMVQINDDYFEDLDANNFQQLLEEMRAGKKVKVGSQTGRTSSEPQDGPKTLLDESIYDPAQAVTPVNFGKGEGV